MYFLGYNVHPHSWFSVIISKVSFLSKPEVVTQQMYVHINGAFNICNKSGEDFIVLAYGRSVKPIILGN